MITWCTILFTVLWLLAIFKVFILDDGSDQDISKLARSVNNEHLSNVDDKLQNTTLFTASASHSQSIVTKHIAYPLQSYAHKLNNGIKSSVPIPHSSEWLFIRSSPDYKVETFTKNVPSEDEQTGSFASIQTKRNSSLIIKSDFNMNEELHWPPVQPDGTIPEGTETMPLIGLIVPKFWKPSAGIHLNEVGTKVNGYETIFLMIASYRDFQCRETITSAFYRADHPERLYVGAVDQIIPGDVGCLDLEVPCSKNANQPICKYRDQISIFKMDAQYATGPVTARHVGDRMYRGQYFVMQMDAHCLFVRHWDSSIIKQFRDTKNEMAVLSSYLTDVQQSIDSNGDSLRNTRPIMCNSYAHSDFEGMMPARYLRHGAQPEEVPEIKEMPQLQPFWAAGFSFSRGHFKLRVPYDAYQPMVFQGEEIAIGIRGFTYGYDYYAPRYSVVFHEYAERSSRRKKIHMFWENSPTHQGEGIRSLKRATSVIGMAPDIDPKSWDHSELDKYGLGNVRPLDLFYKLFLIDRVNRKAIQLCPFVKSGIMHRAFQPFLRSDGMGIDYNQFETFDTLNAIQNHLTGQHSYWEQIIRKAINKRDKEALMEAVNNADRIGLSAKNPQLITDARLILSQI